MSRILIRSGKDPFAPLSAETTLALGVLNANAGNMVFQHAVHKAVMTPGTTVVSNSSASDRRLPTRRELAEINERYDVFVVPLANAFRRSFVDHLARITAWVERLTIPVVVIGVGAQAPTISHGSDHFDPITPTVKAFVSAVLDRSASIGVRGQFTADYLAGIGFGSSSVDVIGCPSLFWHGADFRLPARADRLPESPRISLNTSRNVRSIGDFVVASAERYPRLVYTAQVADDLRLMLWREGEVVTHPSLPTHFGHPLYRSDRVRFPLDLTTWMDHLAGFDFSMGTRFHGNVTAGLAGTPAMLLPHDSRTAELADYHRLPSRPVSSVSSETTTEELYDGYDPEPFNAAYPDRFSTYLRFLERNGLDHVHAEGRANPEFDARLAEVDFPPMAVPLTSPESDEVAARLRWIRDGQGRERRLRDGAEWDESLAETLRAHEGRIADLEAAGIVRRALRRARTRIGRRPTP